MNKWFQWYIGLETTLKINEVIIVQRLVPFANLLKKKFFQTSKYEKDRQIPEY